MSGGPSGRHIDDAPLGDDMIRTAARYGAGYIP